ncbi:zinc-binding dehydrogenase, partial [uncultured Deinococcus sp.]|uniref:zinc-binding dehydrogenase n=1 Tax=uncultured Deinococcus sp. TaxID=158789 RepID=UPI0025877F17
EVPEPRLPFWPLLGLDVTVRFVLVYRMTRQAHEDAIRDTLTGLREGWLKTVVAARYPLDEIAAAHEALESGRTVGKVVVQIP